MERYFGKTVILTGSHPEEKKISLCKSFWTVCLMYTWDRTENTWGERKGVPVEEFSSHRSSEDL